jgi:hypothetical protein
MKTASPLQVWAAPVSVVLCLAACAGGAGQRGIAQYAGDKTIATRVDAALLADELMRAAAYQGLIKERALKSPPPPCEAVLVAEEAGGAKSVKDNLPIRQQ